jgi:hypothetical protein
MVAENEVGRQLVQATQSLVRLRQLPVGTNNAEGLQFGARSSWRGGVLRKIGSDVGMSRSGVRLP